MSPETRGPQPAWSRRDVRRDLIVGALLALPLGVVLSQVSEASYRSGAAVIYIAHELKKRVRLNLRIRQPVRKMIRAPAHPRRPRLGELQLPRWRPRQPR